MSSQPDKGASAPTAQEKSTNRKSFTKFLSRAKTVLKRGEGSSSKRKDERATETKPEKAEKTQAQTAMSKAQEARARYEAMQGVSRLSKAELFEERAKKLGETFGLDIKPSDWQAPTPDDTVLRIDKPIRMRVRRTCHKCNANFTAAKECPNCEHVRCTKCARYPPKRTEAEIIASRERRAALIKANKENRPIVPDYTWEDKGEPLTLPSRTGGKDLVHKKARQRVRRTCHVCKSLFNGCTKTCTKCGHVRCTDCPREPSKKDKYPFGYPGDQFGPSSIPHYECVGCRKVYPTGAENGTKCKKCGVEKSDSSPRARPRKVEPDPDPDVLKSLEKKLEDLSIATQARQVEEAVRAVEEAPAIQAAQIALTEQAEQREAAV